MKYKELYKSGGLFTDVFASEYPDEYKSIFIDTPSEIIDTYSVLKYGDRDIIGAINDDNKETIISSIIAINLHAWVKQAGVLGEEYDVLRPLIREIESTNNSSRDEQITNDIVHSNKFFNEVEYEDGKKENRDNQKGWQEEETFTSVERGNRSPKLISEVIKEEVKLREYNIKLKVIKDLINEITLTIYK